MALEMVLSPLISVAVKKSTDALTEKICGMWDMDENRKTLGRYLLAIQVKIEDAQEQAVNNPALKAWMQDLDAAAHEAVDVLDEFQYEALRLEAISQQPSASSKVIKGFFTHENPFIFRYKMSNKLTKALNKISKLVNEMNTFNLTSRDPPPTIDRETQSFVMESKVIGREREKELIVSELLNPPRERDNISVFAIVGIGGAGKTTLAQYVFNDERVKEHFQLSLWVCVSIDEFNVIEIIKSIIERASGDASKNSKEMLQHELRKILDKKRYLLVLDDVWSKEREKWNELRMLLCSAAGAGSVIIVTTRDQGVASTMEAFPNHNLEKLTDEDSYELFKNRAFGAWVEKPTEEHYEIGKTIAHKCGGLPLVVNAMGGLMGSNQELCYWREILENKVWDSLHSTEEISSILKLSYEYLPSHMKQCFAFCAVFPQDYVIERETLVQLWIANDFIPTDGSMKNIENKGRSIFNELHRRSFFQNIKEEATYEFSEITCQMHDLMHDLATEIAGKKCSTILEPNYFGSAQKEVRHLHVGYHTKFRGINNILKQFPNIHTCMVYDDKNNKPNKIDFYLLKSCSLRALNMREYPPKEIGYMKHIRYLNFSGLSVTALPETISTLYNLQTLKLSRCWNIQKLPSEMRYLINLRHLFLQGCTSLKHMPIGLGQLNYLQTLTKYVLNPSKGGSIRELNQLNLLSGYISLSGLESIRDRDDAQSVNLAKKTNLCSLKLKWDKTSNGGAGNSKPILEALMPHDKLKYLHISGYRGFGFPKWIMEVPIISNLKGLKLKQCINCAELPPLWLLPLLEDLHIEKMGNLISFVGSMCENVEGKKSFIIFPALKNLTIRILPNLESWHEEGSEFVAFPELKTLAIGGCPKLKSVPTHVPLLTYLELNNCTEIKLRQISYLPMLSKLSISLNDMPFREPDAFRPPKNIEELKIVGYENVYPLEEEGELLISCQTRPVLRKLTILKSYCFLTCGPSKVVALEFWKYFAAVEDLVINQCDNLVFWPEEELRSLKCLKNLFVFDCRNLTGALTEQQQASSLEYYLTPPLPLPHLEQFSFVECPELVQVPFVCSKSLKDLSIDNCPKLNIGEMLTHVITDPMELKYLRIIPSTHWSVWPDNMKHLPSLDSLQIKQYLGIELVPPGLHLPSLQELHIYECPGESFPPGLHLPSLVELVITKCPKIKSFPPGLQNRLPSLQRLIINNCPALERSCRSGGDYYDLVSSIPVLQIETYRHKGKSLLKNLPCIRAS
ncbi:NBS-LRR-like resistance protein [Rhynchospora pubera]|uniref:NBS-LRR-like resistance protein n=1 Tax=Rhynchospora pubera TaxID=906938 RepID=A0AAV8EVB0_9POAL|nr:NBS-LRR-like resistance protein [Rhynchospora pubera]